MFATSTRCFRICSVSSLRRSIVELYRHSSQAATVRNSNYEQPVSSSQSSLRPCSGLSESDAHPRLMCLPKPVRRIVCLSKVSMLEEARRNLLPKEIMEECEAEGSASRIRLADQEHRETLELCTKEIQKRGLSVRFVEGSLTVADVQASDLVISIGGDGTFLRAARKIDEDAEVPILGINSSISSSFGFFCTGNVNNFGELLEGLVAGKAPVQPLWRMRIYVDDVPIPAPVLNEVLLAPDCPAITAKYKIRCNGVEQKQQSSGVWIATAAGSTGAIYSAGGEVRPLHERALHYRVRELFPLTIDGTPLVGGPVPEDFEIKSRMLHGGLYLDGAHAPIPINFGSRMKFKPTNKPLLWVAASDSHWSAMSSKARDTDMSSILKSRPLL